MKKRIIFRIVSGFFLILFIMGSIIVYSQININNEKTKLVETARIVDTTHMYLRHNEESFYIMKSYVFSKSSSELELLRSQFAISVYKANKYLNDLKINNDYVFFLTEYYFNLGYSESKKVIYVHDLNMYKSDKIILSDEEALRLSLIESYHQQSKKLMDYNIEKLNAEFDDAQQEFENILNLTIILYILGFVVCVIISILIAQSIIKPIQKLTKTTEEILAGNYKQTFHDDGNFNDTDELEYLNLSFNKMMVKLNDSYNLLAMKTEKLQQSNNIKDEFLSNISHELKTPLTSIKSYCEILRDGLVGKINKKQKESLTIINDSANSLLTLINTLLHISAYEKNKMPLNITKIDINVVLNQVIVEFSNMIKRNKGVLKVISDKKKHWCNLDIEKVKEVFRNLISNAIKYKKNDKMLRIVITINADKQDKYVKIVIKDNGIGISNENMKNIFNKFYQVDQSLSRKVGGTGLGLAITKEIMDCLNGKIKVNSELGIGTEVIVCFPVNL